ncbi:MAG: GtrA family protein [Pontixanthobacter sp.]
MGMKPDPAAILRFVRFGMSTIVSVGLSFGLPIVLHEKAAIAETTAVAIGFAVAYVVNFCLLKLFVYRSQRKWYADLAKYIPVNGGFRLAEYGLFVMLFEYADVDYRIAVLSVLVLTFAFKFFIYRFVFADRAGRTSTATEL